MNELPRAAAGAVLLLVAACGTSHQTSLSASTPTTEATVPSATGTQGSPSTVPATAQASVGTGQASSAGTAAPTTAPATVRPTNGLTTVTDGDAGSTAYLHVGDRLEVHLTQGTYDPPVSSSATLVRRSSSGGYPTAEPVVAVFEAVTRGTADVSATSDAACFHTEPRCLMPIREWIVHVRIS